MKSSAVERVETATRAAGQPDEERREALRNMGKFAAYTAPALITMLSSEKAVSADSLLG
jgi:hypothetical protein